MNLDIPPEIEEQYEGRWIAWDTVTQEVAGDGETLDAAIAAIAASNDAWDAGHELYFHHILPRDVVIVGGL